MNQGEYKGENETEIINEMDSDSDNSQMNLLVRQIHIVNALSDLNQAFERNDRLEVFKSIAAIFSLISNKQTKFDFQIIPKDNLIQMLTIFQNSKDFFDIKVMLQLFSAIIEISDSANDNLQILISNSFLEIIRDFTIQIPKLDANLKKAHDKDSLKKSLLNCYLKVIFQLHNSAEKDPSLGEMIGATFNLGFFFALFKEINEQPITDNERLLWFQTVEISIRHSEIDDPNILTTFLKLCHSELTKIHENTPYDVKLLDVLSLLLSKYPTESINWEYFVSLGFPAILSDLIKCDDISDDNADVLQYFGDYRTISSASKCIVQCALHKFVDFNFTIIDVYHSAIHFDHADMLENLFLAYYNMAFNNVIFRNNFFIIDTNEFVKHAFTYTFHIQNLIGVFFAKMIPLGQSEQIKFLLDPPIVFEFLYHIFQSSDADVVSAVLNCFLNIGEIIASTLSESASEIFAEFIPKDIEQIIDSFHNDECADLFHLVVSKYPFFFDL